ncbi:MAG: patatin-like phospholipase family protein [Burkholderiaceae bacterium]|jgi:NTE family protein|nr:patatin-like phospholipase family protein [Burkholderiaceae bacterium]
MTRRARKRIDLALQGGGAHGAFTWGVLDRLLEDERIEIDAISGTSAGAMNAVALADGLTAGGRRGAREALGRFWSRVSASASAGSALTAFFGDGAMPGSPLGWYVEWFTRTFSPYQFNPLDINPLRDIVAAEIDFDRVRACDRLRVFVSATDVRSGQLREFRTPELSVDTVMASACLPMLFRAVEIDGAAYWDGGYVANPSLLPLITESPAHDLVLVQINPARREAVPTSTQQIVDRLNEITFNSSLIKELRSVALLQQLLAAGGGPPPAGLPPFFAQIAALRMHRIDAGDALTRLGAVSKLNAAWPFVQRLHRIGRDAADRWLHDNFTHLGRRATLPLKGFL